jgi:predicted deacetylase
MKRIAVALHDVEPRGYERCVEIRDWLQARGVDRATLLVVPAPRLHPFDRMSPDLADWLRSRVAAGDAVAQHGLRHLRTHRVGPLATARARAAGGRAAEFAGLDAEATRAALDAGLRVMRQAELPPRGFVAPAYYYTRALRRALPRRFTWWSSLWRVHGRGSAVPAPALCLGTSTPFKRASSPSLARGRALMSGGVLRLDVHPADFEHPAHVQALERILARSGGREAVTYDELVSGVSSRRRAGGRAFPSGAGTVQAPSPVAEAARPRRRLW